MTDERYERGFNDGLRWCAGTLRLAADQVEKSTYADFERKSGNGGTFRAVARTGQIHFAGQLRGVANEIEAAIKRAEADSHDPPTGTPPTHR